MMGSWQIHVPTQAYLVAMDIVGFSDPPDPDRLFHHRQALFSSVEQTTLFAVCRTKDQVKVHFLGDELRLAYCSAIEPPEVHEFVRDVNARLARLNRGARDGYKTEVRGVVLAGVVTWRTWQNCDYLDGALPLRAQIWSGEIGPGEFAADTAFCNALDVAGITTKGFPPKRFPGGEEGFLLPCR